MPEGWSKRVAFSSAGGFAYRPDELFLPRTRAAEALELLTQRQAATEPPTNAIPETWPEVDEFEEGEQFGHLKDVRDALQAVDELRSNGIRAEVNHVLFAHGGCGWQGNWQCGCGQSASCACGPHPALLFANPFSANPFSANPFSANPFSANPFSANPFSANPFSANPFSANPFSANPFSANPFSANPSSATVFQPNPVHLLANAGLSREAAEFRASGWRPHSARPAAPPELPTATGAGGEGVSVVVVDTGVATGELLPNLLARVSRFDVAAVMANRAAGMRGPDEMPDGDSDDRIDPVAGHGTFVAGVIEQVAPGCNLEVLGPIDGYGDVSEAHIAVALESLLQRSAGPPHLVNLSFGGYTVREMARLGSAVRRLQDAGTIVVASAGNDATCRPAYPAAFPGVVSVAALDSYRPAHFTNYGPWVRACAPGVDVVSTFFKKWEAPGDERYAEWVRWSGTSFAAPAVAGALARAIQAGLTGEEAVERLIDDPGLFRICGLGTVVNQAPWWRSPSAP